MKLLNIVLIVFLLSSCASELAPRQDRSFKLIKKTKLNKSESFDESMRYLNGQFTDLSKVVNVKDRDTGIISLVANTQCNVFRQWGDVNDYSVKFKLTLEFKDNKAKIEFDDLRMVDKYGSDLAYKYNQLVSKEQVDKAKTCLDSFVAGLEKSMSEKSDW